MNGYEVSQCWPNIRLFIVESGFWVQNIYVKDRVSTWNSNPDLLFCMDIFSKTLWVFFSKCLMRSSSRVISLEDILVFTRWVVFYVNESERIRNEHKPDFSWFLSPAVPIRSVYLKLPPMSGTINTNFHRFPTPKHHFHHRNLISTNQWINYWINE